MFEDYFAQELETLRELERDGLIAFTASGLTVSPLGRLLIRYAALQFDAYMGGIADRYSMTI